MRNRLLVLALGSLVLVVALAGLFGFLDMLSQGTTIGFFPPDSISGTTSDAGAVSSAGESHAVTGDMEEIEVELPRQISPQSELAPHLPLFEVSGAAHTSYLRTITASLYDGTVWRRAEDEPSYVYSSGETLRPEAVSYISGRGTVLSDVIEVIPLAAFTPGMVQVPTSLYPTQVLSPMPLLYFPREQVFYSEDGLSQSYHFRTSHLNFDERALAGAEVEAEAEYLQLPASISERVRSLALEITKGKRTPYQKAKALEDYLKSHYEYSFEYRPAPEGWEPADWFLFEEPRGVCTHFNSAFVVLCRSLGIPARLVGGFAIAAQAEPQLVYADQAHAWAEVKFKNLDWYTFDATAPNPGPLPTIVEITSINPLIQKGHSFSMQGTLVTDKGKPVDGVAVEVFINSRKETQGGTLIGQGVTSEGSFTIEADIPPEARVGDYHVLAHSLGDVRYEESWSDPIVKVFAATRLRLQAPQQINTKEWAYFELSLVEEPGMPVAGQVIELSLSQKGGARLVTNSEGKFAWKEMFQQPGEYTLRARFSGTEYWLGSSQEISFQVLIPTLISLEVSSPLAIVEAQAYSPLMISGSLVEGTTGAPLPYQAITLLLNGEPLRDNVITTDEAGAFEVEHTFDAVGLYHLEARFSGVPFYRDASAQKVLSVSAPSAIILTTPGSVGTGKTFTIRGSLQDAKTGSPRADQSIQLSIEGSPPGQEVMTDARGRFKLEYAFEEEGFYHIGALFQGSAFYWPCLAGRDVLVMPAGAGFPWLYLAMGMAPVMTGAGGLLIYRWQRRRRPLLAPPTNQAIADGPAWLLPEAESREDGASLSIELPQIDSRLPDVWGLGDELEIAFRLTGPGGERLASRPLEVYIDRQFVVEVTIDSDGRGALTHTFTRRGLHDLAAIFNGEPGTEQAMARRAVRIVDYREEIVELYGALLERFRGRGIDLPASATPREAKQRILEDMEGIPGETLERVIVCFEEADYSLHTMDRKVYQIVYLAWREVAGSAGDPRQKP